MTRDISCQELSAAPKKTDPFLISLRLIPIRFISSSRSNSYRITIKKGTDISQFLSKSYAKKKSERIEFKIFHICFNDRLEILIGISDIDVKVAPVFQRKPF